ncbi:MAG: PEP-CTERM sorting domain-containing protein [Akkermansiaceae bacterium]|nr:PEP-CTERM sorting domain-containing protein [Akkermansiaceae bacterium]
MKHITDTTRGAHHVLAAAFIATMAANAAVVPAPNYSQQDLFLTVRANGGQGDTTSYLVNLGSYYQFAPASQVPPSLQSTFSGATPGSTFQLDIGNIGSDLTRLYGAAWLDRTDLVWGIVGTNNSANATILLSQERVGGNPTTAFAANSTQFNRNLFAGNINSVLYGTNGYNGRLSTLDVHGAGTGSARATEQGDPSAESQGKDAYINHQASTSFGGSLGTVDYEAAFGDHTALDLWRYSSATGVTNAGYFSFDQAGNLSFTAVPEPSALLITIGGSLALIARRRRNA